MINTMIYAVSAWVGINAVLLLGVLAVSLACWIGKPGREKRKAEREWRAGR